VTVSSPASSALQVYFRTVPISLGDYVLVTEYDRHHGIGITPGAYESVSSFVCQYHFRRYAFANIVAIANSNGPRFS
jgi:hypothetical protein